MLSATRVSLMLTSPTRRLCSANPRTRRSFGSGGWTTLRRTRPDRARRDEALRTLGGPAAADSDPLRPPQHPRALSFACRLRRCGSRPRVYGRQNRTATGRRSQRNTMATQEWLDAARNYSLMSESARSEYWKQLTPDQQGALSEALASSEVGTGTPNTASAASSTGAEAWTGSTVTTGTTGTKRGCGGPVGAGCLGMILGCVLTIGAEFAAVSAGIGAIGRMFDGYSGGSSSPRYEVPQEREESNEPPEKEPEKFVGCEDPRYRRE